MYYVVETKRGSECTELLYGSEAGRPDTQMQARGACVPLGSRNEPKPRPGPWQPPEVWDGDRRRSMPASSSYGSGEPASQPIQPREGRYRADLENVLQACLFKAHS